jgi:gluconokinase
MDPIAPPETGPAPAAIAPLVVVVMGVSGSGKTTIGIMLAERLHWVFEEGDSLHPAANIAKMHSGIPLTDEDRMPWLAAVAAWIDHCREGRKGGVITCSALKRQYRRMIIGDRTCVRLIYLKGEPSLIAPRLISRHGHFMAASLLQSQFDTLEEPGPDETPLIVPITAQPQEIADHIGSMLAAGQTGPKTGATGAIEVPGDGA